MDLGKIVRNLSFGALVAATTFSPVYAKEPKDAPKAAKVKKLDLKAKTFVEDAATFATEYLNATYRRPAELEDLGTDLVTSDKMVAYAAYLVENGQKVVEKELGKKNPITKRNNIFPWVFTTKTVHDPDPEFTKNAAELEKVGFISTIHLGSIRNDTDIESRIARAVDNLAYMAPNHRSDFWIPSKKGVNNLGFAYAEAKSSDHLPYFVVVMTPDLRHSINTYKQLLESENLQLPKVVKLPLDGAIVKGRFANEQPNPGHNPDNEYGFCPGVMNFDTEVDFRSLTVAPGKSFVKYDGKNVSAVVKQPRDGFNYSGPGAFLVPPVALPGTKVEWGITLQFKKNGKVEELPISGNYTTK